MDLENHKIISLEIFMAGDHPLVSPYRKPGQEAGPTVIIKVDYEYLARIKKEDVETLSDIISIAENSISPSAKYKGYAIKSLIGKQ